jgi:predicted RNase H-like HicB family nuclease
MKRMSLKNIVWKEGEHYVSQCLNVDISSFGETRKKALENLNEALELYFEDTETPVPSKIIQPKIVDLPFSYA